jgi:hypothetical protein
LHSDCWAYGKLRSHKHKSVLSKSVQKYAWLQDPRYATTATGPAVDERDRTKRVPTVFPRACTVFSNRSFQLIQRPPQLVPLFPVGNYTPSSRCAHRGPIEHGSAFCCMVCHASGQDDHPALQANWSIEPNLELNWTATFSSCKYSKQKILIETRKQRRQRLFSNIRNSLNAYS